MPHICSPDGAEKLFEDIAKYPAGHFLKAATPNDSMNDRFIVSGSALLCCCHTPDWQSCYGSAAHSHKVTEETVSLARNVYPTGQVHVPDRMLAFAQLPDAVAKSPP